jgi:spore maturation protein CgeB
MNILVIGKFEIEDFALHIAETLTAMGHIVQRFEPGYKSSKSSRLGGQLGHRIDQVGRVIYAATDAVPRVRALRMRELWRIVEGSPPDAVIVCHDFLWPSEVKELKRRTRAVIALWFPDAVVNIGRGLFMNAPYDALFFKDPYIVRTLGEVLSSPAFYLPECFNPDRHCLQHEADACADQYACDIATAGNQHAYRMAFFSHLTEYNVKIWGFPAPLWMAPGLVAQMYQGRAVFNHEKARAFTGAKIVLNNLHYGEIWGVNARTFEAAGVGAFQVVDWRPGLRQLFDEGKELICFRSISDLKQKIAYWLPRDDERRSIADAGRRRAYAEHTYRLRLSLLLNTLEGKSNGFRVPHVTMK